MIQQKRLSELLRGLMEADEIDYGRIAREFERVGELGMEGIRSAKEGSLVRVGSGVAASLNSLASILAELGEIILSDKVVRIADDVLAATRPEVRPDEGRLGEQAEYAGFDFSEIARRYERIKELATRGIRFAEDAGLFRIRGNLHALLNTIAEILLELREYDLSSAVTRAAKAMRTGEPVAISHGEDSSAVAKPRLSEQATALADMPAFRPRSEFLLHISYRVDDLGFRVTGSSGTVEKGILRLELRIPLPYMSETVVKVEVPIENRKAGPPKVVDSYIDGDPQKDVDRMASELRSLIDGELQVGDD